LFCKTLGIVLQSHSIYQIGLKNENVQVISSTNLKGKIADDYINIVRKEVYKEVKLGGNEEDCFWCRIRVCHVEGI